MKNIRYRNPILAFILLSLALFSLSCERQFDELIPASYPSTPEVFIDGFSAGLAYAAFGGSNVTAFDVDTEVKYKGTSSMKIAVPDAGDPMGGYAGGVYYTSVGRDLSAYDALTFWAKSTKAATLDVVGFGNDLGEARFQVTLQNVQVNSNWKKYIIPIPDPSKLTQERGMFYYSEAPEEGLGYTFWIDELQFEKLGTVAHKRALIFDGEDEVENTVNGVTIPIRGTSFTFNMPTGIDQTVQASNAYFTFSSSNGSVAAIDSTGTITVLSQGTAVITATSGGDEAGGSLTVVSTGDFVPAPEPTLPAEEVISIFSNAYENVPVDYYNGYWEPFQTTLSADFTANGDDVLSYTNFNFVGIQFTNPPIDASAMSTLHMDVYIPNEVQPTDRLSIRVVDMGPDGTLDGNDPSISYELPGPLASQTWISVDMNLTGLTSRSNLAQIILENLETSLSGFYLDNIYLYGSSGGGATEPVVAAPEPTENEADVISLFSGAYTDVNVDTWLTEWSAATYEEVDVAGNAAKKYSALDFAGIETTTSTIDASGMTHLHLDVWSANITQFGIKLVDFGPDGSFEGGDDSEYQIDYPAPAQGQWVSYDIPLSDFTELTSTSHLAQYVLVGQPSGATTIWVDNVYFYKNGDGGEETAPDVAAPEPTQNEADVISLFSGAYTDITVDTWLTEWSAATYEEVDVAGNAAKKYSAMDFVGIETTTSTVDASGMTHLHLDVWSPNITQFGIKLVDFGADGAFEGGDDSEHQIDYPAPAQGQWVSYDIPLSDFTDLASTSHIAQYILVGQPTGTTTIWVDNVYFYK